MSKKKQSFFQAIEISYDFDSIGHSTRVDNDDEQVVIVVTWSHSSFTHIKDFTCELGIHVVERRNISVGI